MQITAVTAPTRGPDYVAPVASSGTPIVTAPQPTSPVATESAFTAASFAGDTTEVARKKRALPLIERAPPPPRYLTTTRGAISTVLEDMPATYIPFRLAAQAYLAQRRAESDTAAATPEPTTPVAVADEHRASPPTPTEQPLPPPQRSESSSAGSLDVVA